MALAVMAALPSSKWQQLRDWNCWNPESAIPGLPLPMERVSLLLMPWTGAVSKILLGIGGSATNDGGAGMAEALGVKFSGSYGYTFSTGWGCTW